jgi:hypothetical protein
MWTKITTPASNSESDLALTNQTQFGMEKPLFEEPPRFEDPAAKTTQQAKKKKSPLPFILAGLAICVIMFMLLAIVLMKKKTLLPIGPSATPVPVTSKEVDAYKARLDELQQDFIQADPSQTTLPFPPVSLSITLDPPQR